MNKQKTLKLLKVIYKTIKVFARHHLENKIKYGKITLKDKIELRIM